MAGEYFHKQIFEMDSKINLVFDNGSYKSDSLTF